MSDDKEIKKMSWWQPAVVLFAKFSAWIFFPLLIGVPFGQWLDKKYHTEPWLLLALVGVSFVVSIGGLVVGAVKEYKKIEVENKKSNLTSNHGN